MARFFKALMVNRYAIFKSSSANWVTWAPTASRLQLTGAWAPAHGMMSQPFSMITISRKTAKRARRRH